MHKHTPGPWRFYKCPCGMDGCRQYKVSVQGSVGFDEADARLIAAAPDLLNALEMIMAGVAGCERDPEYEAARAAIAKVKGENT